MPNKEFKSKIFFKEHIDTSIIARFPAGWFQKGLDYSKATGREFSLQASEERMFLRDRVTGKIITWRFYKFI